MIKFFTPKLSAKFIGGLLKAKRSFAAILFVAALLAIAAPCKLFAQAPAISSFGPATGPVGTLVTITGSNLSSPTAFTIGGATAVVVSNDGSTLVGLVMPGAVTGAVSLTTAGGPTTGSGNFTVTNTQFLMAQQGSKLVGTGGIGSGFQGYSVALSADGNTAIVSGIADNSSTGAVWVYTRSGGAWTQQGPKLVGTGSAANSQQGYSIALSADGNTAIVGGQADNSFTGAAWVYTRSGGAWTQQGAKLVGTGGVANSDQGSSVALSADGNTAIVGGDGDNVGQGAAWVYTRSGGVWTQQGTKLVVTDNNGSAGLGTSVSLSADGSTAIVGGYGDNSNLGAAWVYTRNGGIWTQQGAKLVGTGNTGIADQGISVSLNADGNTAIVGGYTDNTNQGAAWVYTRSGGAWTQQGPKLVGTGGIGVDLQGKCVALSADGNTAIVGGDNDNSGQGAAWIYTRSGGAWTQTGSKLVGTGNTGAAGQGFSVALSADGSTAFVGGLTDNSSQGAAWVFTPLVAPTTQASNITFTGTTTTTTTASWTSGNGSSRAVFMAAATGGSPAPAAMTNYNPNAAFGSGDQIGASGWYCVYNGAGSTVNITGLTTGTTYQLMVVEYNDTGSDAAYLTTAGTGNPAAVKTLSSDAMLANLTISNGILTSAFSPGTLTYTDAIANFTSGITVVPTTDDPNATITINGNPATPGVRSASIPMSVGANTLTIVVTATDGVTTNTYTVGVTRQQSTNASFTSIALSPSATLVGATGPGTLNFTASVPNSVSSIQAIPTAADATATITVNGQAVSSGTASQVITLPVGQTVITTVITSQDGTTTKSAIITVTRAPSADASLGSLAASAATLSPAFSPVNYTYAATVPYATSSITLTPTTDDPTATVTVNGTTVTSGNASNAINLNVGANTVTTVVTAQNSATSKTYTTIITRSVASTNALLASISTTPATTLIGATGPGYLNFTANVPNSTASIQVTPTAKDPTATITVNGSAVASGTLSQNIPLSVGANTITTVITAQDGITTKTIMITVNRTGAAVASLSNLTADAATLSPAFATGTLSYTATVPYTTATVTLTPTTTDPNATVTVNGNPATTPVTLSVGLNKILTVVTAQNGTTKETYTTNITRTAPSTNALFTSIALSPVSTLVGVTGPAYLNFTSAVPNSETSVQVIATAKDPTATITVNGTPVTSGTLSQPIALNIGANTITTIITAQDGTTTKTAIIAVTRAIQSVNSLYEPVSVAKPTNQVTLNDDGIVVHQSLSPNGDGINDFLAIDNITSYPDNHLTIVDRNGNMVYEAKGYDNASKIFDGHAANGKMQQPGTYFYSLSYTVKGETRNVTGFIILKY